MKGPQRQSLNTATPQLPLTPPHIRCIGIRLCICAPSPREAAARRPRRAYICHASLVSLRRHSLHNRRCTSATPPPPPPPPGHCHHTSLAAAPPRRPVAPGGAAAPPPRALTCRERGGVQWLFNIVPRSPASWVRTGQLVPPVLCHCDVPHRVSDEITSNCNSSSSPRRPREQTRGGQRVAEMRWIPRQGSCWVPVRERLLSGGMCVVGMFVGVAHDVVVGHGVTRLQL